MEQCLSCQGARLGKYNGGMGPKTSAMLQQIGPIINQGNGLRQHISPVTGNLTIYAQTNGIAAHDHQPSPPDLLVAADWFTEQVQSQGYDGYCDGVGYIGGVLTDTSIPSIWMATTQTQQGLIPLKTDGSLGIWFVVFAMIWALLLQYKTVFLIIVALFAVVTIWAKIFPTPLYRNEGGQDVPWSQYITEKNALYWYVCPKDGYPVGLKSQYPTAADVPAADIERWREHCNSAPDIGPKNLPEWLTWIIVGAVAVGGIYIAVKVLPSYLGRKQK